jgi:hypothetical protein
MQQAAACTRAIKKLAALTQAELKVPAHNLSTRVKGKTTTKGF